MAYNNGFPMNYGQYYPQYQQPMYQTQAQPVQQMPQQNQTNGKIWVQGESGAKSYLVAPNTTVDLWDSEQQTIYVKSADASGMPSMKILDYVFRQPTQNQTLTPMTSEQTQPTPDYVTHQELKDFEDRISHEIKEIKEDLSA